MLATVSAMSLSSPLRSCAALCRIVTRLPRRRNLGEFHDGGAVDVGHVSKARNVGDSRAASGVDKETVGGEMELPALGCADDDGFGAGERRLSVEEIEVFGFGDAALAAGAEESDDVALA